jgi:hypothetical protein
MRCDFAMPPRYAQSYSSNSRVIDGLRSFVLKAQWYNELLNECGMTDPGRLIQSSLRDCVPYSSRYPSDKSLGYFRLSLRDRRRSAQAVIGGVHVRFHI